MFHRLKRARIDEQKFREIKHTIKYKNVYRASLENEVSLKTVLQVKGSKNFEEYNDQNKAQHPPLRYSLRDDVLKLHDLIFNNKDNKYIAPPTARKAIKELIRDAK